MDFIAAAKKNEDICIKMRRDLHKIPELELHLPKTSAYVKAQLKAFGIEYIEMIKGNGIVALIQGKSTGKCLAIRADMDALPITEETGLPFSSEHTGCMHACGHDSHTAIALTVAKILSEHKDKLNGTVKFIFQPGEEIPGGAKPMIDEGVLENPHVDYIIGLHGGYLSEIPEGGLGFKEHELMAAMDRFSITITGSGGHGASPHNTVDPIIIAAEVLLGLQKITSREIAPVERAVVSVCKIEGGFTQNIIPDTVSMLGTARSLNEHVRDFIEKRITEIAAGIAHTYGGAASVCYERFYPVLINNPAFTRQIKNRMKTMFSDHVFDLDVPTMGGEDMAFYLQKVPGTFVFLQNAKRAKDGIKYPNHSPKFDLDESQFYKGIVLFLAAVDEIVGPLAL